MKAKLQITPRGRLALVLLHLAAGAAWLSGDDNAQLAASMIAAPLLVDLVAKLATRPRLEVRLSPRRTIARSAFLETLTIRNVGATAHELRIREPRTLVLDAGGAHLPWLDTDTEVTVRVAARSPRRGRAPMRGFVATTVWPLGMFRWRLQVAQAAELVTEPARAPLPADILRALAAHDSAEHPGARTHADEFFGLREYRVGEDARHVHARRSAGLGVLVRKVYRGADDRTCAIVVDLRRPPGMPPTFGRRELELHLSRAAMLADALLARGGGYRCVVVADATSVHDVPPGGGGSDAREFLTELAVAKTVAFRALADEELALVQDADACFWLAAGGYLDGVPNGRSNIRSVGRAAC